jgi:LmbE family N-acetylglucosaminyl deacetylase
VAISSYPGRALFLGVLALGLSACMGAEATEGGHEDDVRERPGAASSTSRDLFIVAHQDDDLLFMNPDLAESVRSAARVRTIYVTAGDADRPESYWSMRQEGIEAAYARMAGVADAWTATEESHAGKSVVVRTLVAAPNVSVVFMRLPNSYDELLERLYDGELATVTTVDGATTYTRGEVVDTLAALVSSFGATFVGTLDATTAFGDDHSDHRASARFAFDALQRVASRPLLRSYRGYNVSGEKVNLNVAEHLEKEQAFSTYAAFDDAICAPGQACVGSPAYVEWQWRRYAASTVSGTTGRIGLPDGRCMATDAAGRAIAAERSSAPTWSLREAGELASGGRCLTLGQGGAEEGTVFSADCDGGASQRWTLFDDGQLRGASGGCLGASTANAGSALVIAPCTAAAAQLWTARFGEVASSSSPGQFADADLGADATYWGTVRYGDVNGDGRADACVRKVDGVYCARGTAAGFDPYARYTTEFSDALGWRAVQYATTLQLADVTGDGKADVCGRGYYGILCATSNAAGTAFTAPKLWGSAFSNAAGFANAKSYYGSIRLADVDGDGYADVCGRGANGILCAVNTRTGSFAGPTTWLAGEFTDGLGWYPDQYGSTIQLGDIDGDGRADLCGRGAAGLLCARSKRVGQGFEGARDASFRTDFSNAAGWAAGPAYYGSIGLADINGDGRADACGRSPDGIVCGLSDGAAFARALRVLPQDFTDALGWAAAKYGATIRFPDLDGDGHADVCGRGTWGLLCSRAP